MLPSFVSLAANPVSPLRSHPCILRASNSLIIKSLRKNPRGRGPATLDSHSKLRALCALCDESLFRSVASVLHYPRLSDWIHNSSNKMQESPRAPRPTFLNNCHPERSEGSAFRFLSTISPVDTIRRLPYSASANDFANPSPPSSSRHSAALDELCVADSLTQDSHHPLAQRPSGFFVFTTRFFARFQRS